MENHNEKRLDGKLGDSIDPIYSNYNDQARLNCLDTPVLPNLSLTSIPPTSIWRGDSSSSSSPIHRINLQETAFDCASQKLKTICIIFQLKMPVHMDHSEAQDNPNGTRRRRRSQIFSLPFSLKASSKRSRSVKLDHSTENVLIA